jgi:AcrR family transcriptional regulator
VRRGEILAAARQLLVEDGYDRFVLRTIAERIGVTLGHLQYYFPTRDDLLEAVVRAEFARNQEETAALATGPGAPETRLAAVARHLIDVWAHEGGRVYVVMSLLALHQPRFRALHREIYAAFYAGLLPVLRRIRPRATRTELLDAARLITTLIDGALVQVPSRTFVADAVGVILALARAAPGRPGAAGRRWRATASGSSSRTGRSGR